MERHKRIYAIEINNNPPGWIVVQPEDIANAVARVSDYLKDLSSSLSEAQKTMLGVRKIDLPYQITYQFGENCVIECFPGYVGEPSLIINTGSREGLETLLKISELGKFEPKEKPSKRKK